MDKPTIAESLRMLADWYEANPDTPPPYKITAYAFGADCTPDKVRQIARALGSFDKNFDAGGFLTLSRRFGDLDFAVTAYRDGLCTKRTVTKTVEAVEWVCEPLLEEKEAA